MDFILQPANSLAGRPLTITMSRNRYGDERGSPWAEHMETDLSLDVGRVHTGKVSCVSGEAVPG